MNRARSVTILYLTLIVIAGFLIRLINFKEVFYDGLVIFPGYDPYYHMTRIFQVLTDWPTVPSFDAAMNFPFGAVIIWPPLFDFAIATLCLAFGFGPGDVYAVETVAAFTIPAIGAVTAIPVYLLSVKVFGDRRMALFAAAFLALTPAHIWYSLLGFVDQHVAVTFIQITMFFLFLKGAEALENRDKLSVKLWWLGAAALSLITGMLVWNGYIFYVAILDLFLLVLLILDGRRPGSLLPVLLWSTHIAAAIILAPFVSSIVASGGGPFAAITLSWFHVGAIAAAGLFGLIFHGYYSSTARSLSPALRIAILAAAVAVIAAGPLIMIDTIKEGLGWVFTKDPFMAQVSESQPIFIYNGKFTFTAILNGTTIFFLLTPIMMALAGAVTVKDRWENRKRLFFLLWVGMLFLVTLKQRRFAEAYAPAQAILIARFIPIFVKSFSEHSFFSRLKARSALILSWAFVAVVVIFSLWPFFSGSVSEKMTAEPGESRGVKTYIELKEFAELLFPGKSPGKGVLTTMEYGVVNPWEYGHQILYITGLPVVSNNFGLHIGVDSYHDWSYVFLTKKEEEAMSLLEKRRIRYIVTNDNIFSAYAAMLAQGRKSDDFFKKGASSKASYLFYQPTFISSVLFRLQKLNGSARLLTNQKGNTFAVPPLTRFRLIFDKSAGKEKGQIKVFEIVKGAKLEITAKPGELINVTYLSSSLSGVKKTYSQTLTANSDGVAKSVIPYPSDRPDLGFSSSYTIRGDSGEVKLFAPEKAVQEGDLLSVDILSPS